MTRYKLLLPLIALLYSFSYSQGEFSVGVTPTLSIPIHLYQGGTGGGGFVTGDFLFDYSSVAITASVGYLNWGSSASAFSFRAGGRIYFMLEDIRPYIQVESGINLMKSTYSYSYPVWSGYGYTGGYINSTSTYSETLFVLAPEIGVSFFTGEFYINASGSVDLIGDFGDAVANIKIGASFPLQ
jgi:hypothetical protein